MLLRKQWGEWAPLCPYYEADCEVREGARRERHILLRSDGSRWDVRAGQPPGDCWIMARVGKKKGGRLLDGREWNEFPEVTDG